jgi:hypothetical protein
MVLEKVLYLSASVFGFFLVALGSWGLRQYLVYMRQKNVYAEDYVFSFCSFYQCQEGRMPIYCSLFLFIGVSIMIDVATLCILRF